MDTIGSSLSAEELEFCISALQLKIEDIERDLQENKHSNEEKETMMTRMKHLDQIQDEFLLKNNAFQSTDLLQVCQLVEEERDYLNTILDQPNAVGEMRRMAQQHLRTANSVLRKLKKYFYSFGIQL